MAKLRASSKSKKLVKFDIDNLSCRELLPEELSWACPAEYLNFKSTKDLKPLEDIVGQPRAIEALKLGAELKSKGYNIFVSGLSGTGRLSTVQNILENITTTCPVTYDYCYVNNFSDADRPRLIKLPRGMGKEFAKSMKDTVAYLKKKLPKLFEEDNFQIARKKVIEEYQAKERDILNEFDSSIKPFGFVRGQIETPQGMLQPEVFPLFEGKPYQIESLPELVKQGKVTEEKSKEIEELYDKFHNEIYELSRKGLKIMQEFKSALADYDKAAFSTIVSPILEGIIEKYKNEKVEIYINEVKEFILNNLSIFVPATQIQQEITVDEEGKAVDRTYLFTVNVILDNSETKSAPVIVETSPTYTNLFGTIERSLDNTGYWKTDFSKIKAGSLLRADQGYLIINALDIFQEAGVWNALKRVLLYDKLEIQPFEAYFQLSQLHLKPEPIDVNIKIILIGGLSLYRTLYSYEKGFKKIFKINAQFDHETEKNEEMILNYAKFIAKICNDEQLPHCSPDGTAAIIEWAVKHSGSKDKITLKFSDVADILREAAFYHKESSETLITRDTVQQAIVQRDFRNNLIDEKLKAYILKGITLIDTVGERVGQINGLTVLDTGMYYFGKPVRITAAISAGNAGIINVEREADLSGAIHNKGVLILSGIIRNIFAQKKPLTLSASLAFEQSYSGVDGDSATAAEVIAILSALCQVPIKQNLAITGSVNQLGDVQPIGGVNEKITGFYEICKERGFSGDQGVLIPVQNIDDLMLDNEIIDACKRGDFRIYCYGKLEEAVELLMGMKACERNAKGAFAKECVYGKVEKRLDELRAAVQAVPAVSKKKKKDNKKSAKKIN